MERGRGVDWSRCPADVSQASDTLGMICRGRAREREKEKFLQRSLDILISRREGGRKFYLK